MAMKSVEVVQVSDNDPKKTDKDDSKKDWIVQESKSIESIW